ncbi:hypothetical protein AAMO2058_000266100 [Amorphochlora amoebiformis]
MYREIKAFASLKGWIEGRPNGPTAYLAQILLLRVAGPFVSAKMRHSLNTLLEPQDQALLDEEALNDEIEAIKKSQRRKRRERHTRKSRKKKFGPETTPSKTYATDTVSSIESSPPTARHRRGNKLSAGTIASIPSLTGTDTKSITSRIKATSIVPQHTIDNSQLQSTTPMTPTANKTPHSHATISTVRQRSTHVLTKSDPLVLGGKGIESLEAGVGLTRERKDSRHAQRGTVPLSALKFKVGDPVTYFSAMMGETVTDTIEAIHYDNPIPSATLSTLSRIPLSRLRPSSEKEKSTLPTPRLSLKTSLPTKRMDRRSLKGAPELTRALTPSSNPPQRKANGVRKRITVGSQSALERIEGVLDALIATTNAWPVKALEILGDALLVARCAWPEGFGGGGKAEGLLVFHLIYNAFVLSMLASPTRSGLIDRPYVSHDDLQRICVVIRTLQLALKPSSDSATCHAEDQLEKTSDNLAGFPNRENRRLHFSVTITNRRPAPMNPRQAYARGRRTLSGMLTKKRPQIESHFRLLRDGALREASRGDPRGLIRRSLAESKGADIVMALNNQLNLLKSRKFQEGSGRLAELYGSPRASGLSERSERTGKFPGKMREQPGGKEGGAVSWLCVKERDLEPKTVPIPKSKPEPSLTPRDSDRPAQTRRQPSPSPPNRRPDPPPFLNPKAYLINEKEDGYKGGLFEKRLTMNGSYDNVGDILGHILKEDTSGAPWRGRLRALLESRRVEISVPPPPPPSDDVKGLDVGSGGGIEGFGRSHKASGIGRGTKVCAEGLGEEVRTSEVRRLFSGFGTIRSCELEEDINSKGMIGTIEYDSEPHAAAAVQSLDGYTLHGHVISVGFPSEPVEASTPRSPARKPEKEYAFDLRFDSDMRVTGPLDVGAERAGVKEGWKLLLIDGLPVQTRNKPTNQLSALLSHSKPPTTTHPPTAWVPTLTFRVPQPELITKNADPDTKTAPDEKDLGSLKVDADVATTRRERKRNIEMYDLVLDETDLSCRLETTRDSTILTKISNRLQSVSKRLSRISGGRHDQPSKGMGLGATLPVTKGLLTFNRDWLRHIDEIKSTDDENEDRIAAGHIRRISRLLVSVLCEIPPAHIPSLPRPQRRRSEMPGPYDSSDWSEVQEYLELLHPRAENLLSTDEAAFGLTEEEQGALGYRKNSERDIKLRAAICEVTRRASELRRSGPSRLCTPMNHPLCPNRLWLDAVLLNALSTATAVARGVFERMVNIRQDLYRETMKTIESSRSLYQSEARRLHVSETKLAVSTFVHFQVLKFRFHLPAEYTRREEERAPLLDPIEMGSAHRESPEGKQRENSRIFYANSLTDFEIEFRSYSEWLSEDPSVAAKCINAFLTMIHDRLLNSHRSPTFAREKAAKDATFFIAEYIYARIYYIVANPSTLKLEDDLLTFKRESLQELSPADIGLPSLPGIRNSPEIWEETRSLIHHLKSCFSPLRKAKKMMEVFKRAVQIVRAADPKQALDADTCLSVLVYALIQTPKVRLRMHVKFVEWFSGDYGTPLDVMTSQLGYCYTQFVIALQYLSSNEIYRRSQAASSGTSSRRVAVAATKAEQDKLDKKGGVPRRRSHRYSASSPTVKTPSVRISFAAARKESISIQQRRRAQAPPPMAMRRRRKSIHGDLPPEANRRSRTPISTSSKMVSLPQGTYTNLT